MVTLLSSFFFARRKDKRIRKNCFLVSSLYNSRLSFQFDTKFEDANFVYLIDRFVVSKSIIEHSAAFKLI